MQLFTQLTSVCVLKMAISDITVNTQSAICSVCDVGGFMHADTSTEARSAHLTESPEGFKEDG